MVVKTLANKEAWIHSYSLVASSGGWTCSRSWGAFWAKQKLKMSATVKPDFRMRFLQTNWSPISSSLLIKEARARTANRQSVAISFLETSGRLHLAAALTRWMVSFTNESSDWTLHAVVGFNQGCSHIWNPRNWFSECRDCCWCFVFRPTPHPPPTITSPHPPSPPLFQIRPARTRFDRWFGFEMNRAGFNDVRSLHSHACKMLTALISPPELVRRRTPLPCCVDATASLCSAQHYLLLFGRRRLINRRAEMHLNWFIWLVSDISLFSPVWETTSGRGAGLWRWGGGWTLCALCVSVCARLRSCTWVDGCPCSQTMKTLPEQVNLVTGHTRCCCSYQQDRYQDVCGRAEWETLDLHTGTRLKHNQHVSVNVCKMYCETL